MYLTPGVRLHERYTIEGVLGHGGFGITYVAHDILLNIRVAIKEYLPRLLATRGEGHMRVSVYTGEARQQYEYGLRKFLEESQSVARFSHHPNIVSARDYFEANGTAYMVMEYVEGVTLKEYLEKKGGRISFEEAKGIMMPVMDALREVHQAGLLHRDISPDNIYITRSGQVKVLDFGAARYFSGEQSKSLSIILKLGYAPEEQYRSSGKQASWTDVYAVGATLYKCLTGRTPPEALDRQAEDTLEPPSRLGVAIDAAAEQALLKALAVKASQRFQTIQEFQQSLRGDEPVTFQFQENPPWLPPQDAPLTQAVSPAARKMTQAAPQPVYPPGAWGGSGRPVAITAGIVGLVLLAGAVWFFLDRQGPGVKPPDQAKELLASGIAAFEAKDYDRVLAELQQVVRLSPPEAEAYLYLGLTYAALKRYPEAMEAYRQAIKIKPDSPQAYLNLGAVYEKLDKPQEAMAAWKAAARVKPEDGMAYYKLATLFWQRGEKNLALEHYKILETKDVELARILREHCPDLVREPSPQVKLTDEGQKILTRGMEYYKARNYQKARESFTEAVRIMPEEAQAHYYLGLTNALLGLTQESLEACRKAVTLKPETYSWREVGSAYAKLGRGQEAVEALKEAIAVNQSDSQAHYQLGETYVQLDQINLAKEKVVALKDQDQGLANKLQGLINQRTGVGPRPKDTWKPPQRPREPPLRNVQVPPRVTPPAPPTISSPPAPKKPRPEDVQFGFGTPTVRSR
jgi:tetratricopeptide (TPR) repeat protein